MMRNINTKENTMNEKIRTFVVANGMMMIHVENQDIIITAYKNELRIPLEIVEVPPEWKRLETDKEGLSKWALTSDIFDIFEEELSMGDLNSETTKDVLAHMLSLSIQYIAKIIIEEGVAVLIVNSYNDEIKYLLSTIGLLEDVRIIFAEIKEKGKDNSPC